MHLLILKLVKKNWIHFSEEFYYFYEKIKNNYDYTCCRGLYNEGGC